MLPPLRFYSSVSNVDASPDALASGFELLAYPAFPLERFAFDHACPYVPIGAFHVRSRLLFDAQRQTERLAECFVPIPPWVGTASSAFSKAIRLSNSVGSLRDCAFLCGDPDGKRENEETAEDRRTESAARRGGIFAQAYWPCHAFRGESVGATRPKPAPRRLVSLDSLHLIRRVGAFYAARAMRV